MAIGSRVRVGSQEIEVILKGSFWFQVVLAAEVSDLVSVEADTWETDGTLPVGEVVALVVGQLAELVKGHAGVVGNDEVLGWSDGTHGNLVWNQKELEVVGHNILVDHRTWLWVSHS